MQAKRRTQTESGESFKASRAVLALTAVAVAISGLIWLGSTLGMSAQNGKGSADADLAQVSPNESARGGSQAEATWGVSPPTNASSMQEAQGQPVLPETACPIQLPSDCSGVTYRQGATTESWQGHSAMSCRNAAKEILLGLREDGYELVEAGFLDLSKNAWGCTVRYQDEASLIISLIPRKMGSSSGSTTILTVNVVRIRVPDAKYSGGGEP